MTQLTSITFTAEQAQQIVNESLNRGLFENDTDGRPPSDPKVIMEVAQEIVRQARLARVAGNRGDSVRAVLFLAEVDYDQPSEPHQSLSSPSTVRSEGEQSQMAADLTDEKKFPHDNLRTFEKSLMNYPQPHGQDVLTGLEDVRAELKRRNQPTALEMMHASAPVAPTPEAVVPVQPQPVAQVIPATPAPPVIAQNIPPVDSPAEPSAPVTLTEDPAERTDLLNRLTFPMMREHGIDPSQIDALTLDQLRLYVDGVVAPDPVTSPHTAVLAEQDAAENAMATRQAADSLPPDPDAISPEREELEGQVTGPMLKVFRRGRRDIPSIGDHELRLMVENPEGKISQAQLDAARAQDSGGSAPTAPVINHAPVSRAPLSPPEASAAADQVRDEARAGQVQEPTIQHVAPPASVAAQEPAQPASAPFAPPPAPEPAEPVKRTRAPSPPQEQGPISDPIPVTVQEGLADEIVARERFPIPPEVEEDPPTLPADMSKLPRDEIYSLHARFHALESRVGWVLGTQEDGLADIEKLRRGREVEVANSLPPKIGTAKMTESQRDSLVAADEGVRNYSAAEHEMKKVIRKLKYLRDDYHKSVERASRQLTKWSNEYGGGK